jgi:hypothetical protein
MSKAQIKRQLRQQQSDMRKLARIERHGSRRAKVFAKRARKLEWTAIDIVTALRCQ